MRSPIPPRPVLLGLLGTVLLAIYPFALGYLPQPLYGVVVRHASWLRSGGGRMGALVLGLLGIALITYAWVRLHPSREPAARHTVIAGLWSVPFLLVPPVQSGDAFAYAAQAWVLGQGMDPYLVPQGYPSPFSPAVWWGWADTTAVYPPLILFVQLGVLRLSGTDPYWSVVAMRVMALAGVAATCALMPRLARDHGTDPRRAQWLFALNPVTIVLLIGGAHNDALMMAALACALWLSRRRGPGAHGGLWGLLGAAVMIGVAASLKQAAVLAAPGIVLAGLDRGQRRSTPALRQWLRVALAGAVGGLTFLAVSAASGLHRWGLGWMNSTAGDPASVTSFAPVSWLVGLLRRSHLSTLGLERALALTSTAAILLALAWLTWRVALRRPLLYSVGALAAFSVLGQAMQPWYVAWMLPFLALEPLSRTGRKLLMAASVAFPAAALMSTVMPAFAALLLSLGSTVAWFLTQPTPETPTPLEGH